MLMIDEAWAFQTTAVIGLLAGFTVRRAVDEFTSSRFRVVHVIADNKPSDDWTLGHPR